MVDQPKLCGESCNVSLEVDLAQSCARRAGEIRGEGGWLGNTVVEGNRDQIPSRLMQRETGEPRGNPYVKRPL